MTMAMHVRLADFGLLAIISDSTTPTVSSSLAMGGTTRWMSPELLAPGQYNLKDSRPTKDSDCYAFGMVIYEVLSGQVPFVHSKEVIVMRKIIDGERPDRPEGAKGAWFTDDLWETLTQCWETQPGSRPGIEAVLERLALDQDSNGWMPSPLPTGGNPKADESDWELEMESLLLHPTPKRL